MAAPKSDTGKQLNHANTDSLDTMPQSDTQQTIKPILVQAPIKSDPLSSIITQVLQPAPVASFADKYAKYRQRLERFSPQDNPPSVRAPSVKPPEVLEQVKQQKAVQRKRPWMSTLFMCCVPQVEEKSNVQEVKQQPIKATAEEKDEPVTSVVAAEDSLANLPQLSDSSFQPPPLLPALSQPQQKICLVVDLDETLVHSSFKPIPNPDFIVPVDIEGIVHQVYVLKRPHCDKFLEMTGELFEVAIFTASLRKYADPVIDMLDPPYQPTMNDPLYNADKVGEQRRSLKEKHGLKVQHRLFRESCVNYRGIYVKDLSLLGRDLSRTIILDNSPASYSFHASNALPVTTWFNDPADIELDQLVDILQVFAKSPKVDVREIIGEQM